MSKPVALVKRLVVVDSAIASPEDVVTTTDDIMIVLTPDQDGIAQITNALHQNPAITHLYVLVDGAPGCLHLGNAQLNLETLDRYAWTLQSWFSDPAAIPQLLLKGCNVAAGDSGGEFVKRLRDLTGAEIVASTVPASSYSENRSNEAPSLSEN